MVPAESTDTPTSRPGRERALADRVAMKPAWGPPKPRGTPKRWAEPTTTSAPSSPGGVIRQQASRSVVAATRVPAAWHRSTIGPRSATSPVVAIWATRAP